MKLKILLVLAITILSTTQTQAGSVTSLFDGLN